MLKKRIIPCLDIKNGRTVKGVNFENIRDAGDPVELAKRYADQGADELVFLDISATDERRATLLSLVSEIAKVIHIPFTVGGGITSVADAKAVINAGADKISINSACIQNPQLIIDIALEMGSQCVVVAVDTKRVDDVWMVFTHGGQRYTGLKTLEWLKTAESLGAGEILLTSIENDGERRGFHVDLYRQAADSILIPVIASGGGGIGSHFVDVFSQTKVSAALAASIFHDDLLPIPRLKDYLKTHQIPVRCI
jgi:cyclase